MEMNVLLIPDTEMTVDKCVEACFAADQRMAGMPDTGVDTFSAKEGSYP